MWVGPLVGTFGPGRHRPLGIIIFAAIGRAMA